jgi:hypothetical protein
VYEKIAHHHNQKNANQNQIELSPQTCQCDYYFIKGTMAADPYTT